MASRPFSPKGGEATGVRRSRSPGWCWGMPASGVPPAGVAGAAAPPRRAPTAVGGARWGAGPGKAAAGPDGGAGSLGGATVGSPGGGRRCRGSPWLGRPGGLRLRAGRCGRPVEAAAAAAALGHAGCGCAGGMGAAEGCVLGAKRDCCSNGAGEPKQRLQRNPQLGDRYPRLEKGGCGTARPAGAS